MFYKAGEAYVCEFTTSKFSTGERTDADLSPSPIATASKNGVDDPLFVLTVTKVATGRYKITGTVPSPSPAYVTGDRVTISVVASVDSVVGCAILDHFQVVADDWAKPGDEMDLVSAFDAAKTAAQETTLSGLAVTVGGLAEPGDQMTLTSAYDAAKTAAQQIVLSGLVVDVAGLAKPGDAMTLTGDYDAAKTAAQEGTLSGLAVDISELAKPGDAMTLTPIYDAAKAAAQQTTLSGLVVDVANLDIPSATDIRTEMDTNSTKLVNLDAKVSDCISDSEAASVITQIGDIHDDVAAIGGRETLYDLTWNYNGNDFRFLDGGSPVNGGTVKVFKATDYYGGFRGAQQLKGSTTTNALGRWVAAISLPDNSYVIELSKSGVETQTFNFSL